MRRVVFLVLTFLLAAGFVMAQPTRLVVRVLAHDAKFVGTAVGGLKVVVKDYFTGEILGVKNLEGGTGSTKVIMKEPRIRGKEISVGKATAKAEFVFDINEPRKLQIEVVGPLAAGLNVHREVKTTWLIPGKNIEGDGILFEFYGLIVHPYLPKPHEFYHVGKSIRIGAHVTPMCGCPVRPGFLWDANKYNVKAYVYYGGKRIAEIPLKYAGRISHFEGSFKPERPGGYKVVITACDEANNQGVGITSFVVVPVKKYRAILGR